MQGELRAYYEKLFAEAERVAHPDRACFSSADKSRAREDLLLPNGWKALEKRPFLNGGIPVVAFIFGRNKN